MKILKSAFGDLRLIEPGDIFKASAPGEVFCRTATMMLDGRITTVAAVYSFENGAEQFLGVLDDKGQVRQPPGEVQKSDPKGDAAPPATVGEQASDTATQRAARVRLYQQRMLERRQVELEDQIEDTLDLEQAYALIDELGVVEGKLRALREPTGGIAKSQRLNDLDLLELGQVRSQGLSLPESEVVEKSDALDARLLSDPFGLRSPR